jgi:Lar family restriction alleviation protein
VEIKSCPFCGGTKVECFQYDEDGDYAAIFCCRKNCRASGPPVDAIHGEDEYDEEATYDKALKAWNRRTAAAIRGRK